VRPVPRDGALLSGLPRIKILCCASGTDLPDCSAFGLSSMFCGSRSLSFYEDSTVPMSCCPPGFPSDDHRFLSASYRCLPCDLRREIRRTAVPINVSLLFSFSCLLQPSDQRRTPPQIHCQRIDVNLAFFFRSALLLLFFVM